LGLDIHEISAQEMSLLAPFLSPRDIRAISYVPSDLYLEDPGQLPRGYAHAAGRRGVTILANNRITGIGIVEGRVVRLSTDQGEIRTPVVVDAAGAWTRLLAERLEIRVPLIPVRHQLYITEPIPGIETHQPICRIYDASVYMRPHQGGLLLGGYERDPQFYEMRALPDSFQIRDMTLEIGVLRDLARLVRDQMMVGRDVPIREHRGGLPTMTADGLPIIGPAPGVEGFYIVSGCCVGGLSISPAVGQLVAEQIHTGASSIPLDRYAISRFGPEWDDEERLREACKKQYTEFYAAISQA
jgi:glycine/D-amino acid oxidase-like deaminating enzyme